MYDDDQNDEPTLNDRFEEVNDDFLKFEKIPEAQRLNADEKLCGFLYISARLENPKNFPMDAWHDKIYLASESDLKAPLTDDDILYLVRCGIGYDSEVDSLYCFT